MRWRFRDATKLPQPPIPRLRRLTQIHRPLLFLRHLNRSNQQRALWRPLRSPESSVGCVSGTSGGCKQVLLSGSADDARPMEGTRQVPFLNQDTDSNGSTSRKTSAGSEVTQRGTQVCGRRRRGATECLPVAWRESKPEGIPASRCTLMTPPFDNLPTERASACISEDAPHRVYSSVGSGLDGAIKPP